MAVKLCEAIIDDVAELVGKGNFIKTACAAVGISYPAHYRWMQKGRDGIAPLYVKYYQAITKAEADAEINAVNAWRKEIPHDWRAAKDFLTTRFNKDWGKQGTVTVQHQGSVHQDMLSSGLDFTKLTDEEVDQLEQLIRKATVVGSNPSGESVPASKQLY